MKNDALLWHGCLKNVKHDAGDTSDHAKETHAGANKKNMTNGPWKMCRFVFVCFVFCLTCSVCYRLWCQGCPWQLSDGRCMKNSVGEKQCMIKAAREWTWKNVGETKMIIRLKPFWLKAQGSSSSGDSWKTTLLNFPSEIKWHNSGTDLCHDSLPMAALLGHLACCQHEDDTLIA